MMNNYYKYECTFIMNTYGTIKHVFMNNKENCVIKLLLLGITISD